MPDPFNRPSRPAGSFNRPVANVRNPTGSSDRHIDSDSHYRKPNFDLMWKNFPDHVKYPKLIDLHTHIGGVLEKNIHTPGFGPEGNTCAVRMSRALNYGSAPISKSITSRLKISTLTGGDGLFYIFRVREIKIYLSAALGAANKVATSDFMNAFKGARGIVSFDVQGWRDASGHVALWDGSKLKEEHDDYRQLRDNPATPVKEPATVKMTLWKL